MRDEESENKIRKTGESSALASTSVLQSAMQKLIDEKKAEHELSAEQCKSAQGSAEIERVFNKMDESVGYRLGSKSDSTKVEKMEVETTEQPSDANEHMEDDDDVGEIHIVSYQFKLTLSSTNQHYYPSYSWANEMQYYSHKMQRQYPI